MLVLTPLRGGDEGGLLPLERGDGVGQFPLTLLKGGDDSGLGDSILLELSVGGTSLPKAVKLVGDVRELTLLGGVRRDKGGAGEGRTGRLSNPRDDNSCVAWLRSRGSRGVWL